MKHNILSVSQMCDQGHKLMFNSHKCEIIKASSDKLVATIVRTSNNIYVLSEIWNEKCCLGKEDEIWLWHRRMGHIHFDNLVNLAKEKQSEKCPISRNQPTLYASIANKEGKQRPGSNQRNIQQQNHWKLCILI